MAGERRGDEKRKEMMRCLFQAWTLLRKYSPFTRKRVRVSKCLLLWEWVLGNPFLPFVQFPNGGAGTYVQPLRHVAPSPSHIETAPA